MGFPESLWPEIIAGAIAHPHAADKLRKRLGKYHPKWGDGTLTDGIRQNNAPAPFPNATIRSQDHMWALALVSSALSVKGANQTRALQS